MQPINPSFSSNTINICLATDNNYIQYTATTVASILYNANKKQSASYSFYILHTGLSKKNIKKFNKLKKIYKCKINFCLIQQKDLHLFQNIPIPSHINISAYYRLFIPKILPHLDKVIYLDSDLIAVKSIEDISNIDINGYYFAGVKDLKSFDMVTRLKYSTKYTYINSGVLIINIQELNKHNYMQDIVNTIKTCSIKYGDQDIINATFYKKIKLIDAKYNMHHSTAFWIEKGIKDPYFKNSINNPAIIHYIGSAKPWLTNCNHEYAFLYKYYFKLTPWGKNSMLKKLKLGLFTYNQVGIKKTSLKLFNINLFSLKKYKFTNLKAFKFNMFYIPILSTKKTLTKKQIKIFGVSIFKILQLPTTVKYYALGVQIFKAYNNYLIQKLTTENNNLLQKLTAESDNLLQKLTAESDNLLQKLTAESDNLLQKLTADNSNLLQKLTAEVNKQDIILSTLAEEKFNNILNTIENQQYTPNLNNTINNLFVNDNKIYCSGWTSSAENSLHLLFNKNSNINFNTSRFNIIYDYYILFSNQYNLNQYLCAYNAKKYNQPIIFAESAFIFNISSWDNKYKDAVGFILDDISQYFNCLYTNRLEQMLNNKNLIINTEQISYAKKIIQYIIKNKITKYNNQPIFTPNIGRNGVKKILVVDQVNGDLSVLKGKANTNTFKEMLDCAIKDHPNADIIIKTHPDPNRQGYYKLDYTYPSNVYLYSKPINPISLLEYIDEVYVCSSQLGFEALMCGKKVNIFGIPFYAGWGLANEKQTIKRRNTKRTLEEVFYISYIMYTKYVSPIKKEACSIEDAIEYIINQRNKYFKENNREF